MLAVIKTGGKQYLVAPGQKLKIEKLENKPSSAKASLGPIPATGEAAGKESDEVVFNEVLLIEKDDKLEIGTPYIIGAKVTGKVISQGKGKKVIAFKYKAKKRYHKKKGHRQAFTEVEIKTIELKP